MNKKKHRERRERKYLRERRERERGYGV